MRLCNLSPVFHGPHRFHIDPNFGVEAQREQSEALGMRKIEAQAAKEAIETGLAKFIQAENKVFGMGLRVCAENQPEPAVIDNETSGEMLKAEAPGTILFIAVEEAEIAREFDRRLRLKSPDMDFALFKARRGNEAGANGLVVLRGMRIDAGVQIRS